MSRFMEQVVDIIDKIATVMAYMIGWFMILGLLGVVIADIVFVIMWLFKSIGD